MNFKAVIFDFDGVLGKGLFYQSTMEKQYPEVYTWIQENIFSDKELTDNWMRGKYNSKYINGLVSQSCDIDQNLLTKLYQQSVVEMRIDEDMLEHARKFKERGKKVIIVSNNMDVFSIITAKRKELSGLFDFIINSYDYKLLKKDNDGELYKIALARLGMKAEEVLLIDDSENAISIFTSLGGNAHLFQGIDKLNTWVADEVRV